LRTLLDALGAGGDGALPAAARQGGGVKTPETPDDKPFTLANEAPRTKPARFENNSARQMVLLAGLDCLPGQRDLFATDGEEPRLARPDEAC